MNKATIRIFIDWLEAATKDEIIARRDEFEETQENVTGHESKMDLTLGLRLIDEELISRMERANLPLQISAR